jgi:hypothetical protein
VTGPCSPVWLWQWCTDIVFQTGRPARARPEHDLARPYQARQWNSAVSCYASCRSGGPSTTRWPFFRAVSCLSTMAPAVGLMSCQARWQASAAESYESSEGSLGGQPPPLGCGELRHRERDLRFQAAARSTMGARHPPPGRRESVAGRATSAAGPRRAPLERGSRGGGSGAGGRGTREAERGGGEGRVAVWLRVAGGEIAGPGGALAR